MHPDKCNFTIDAVSNTMLSRVNPALRNDMKKLLVILLMTLCASAMAQRHHGGGYWGRGYGGGWQWIDYKYVSNRVRAVRAF